MPLYQLVNLHSPVLSQFSLRDKIAAVTGGARRIGLETVQGLTEARAGEALIYTSSPDSHESAARVAASTGQRVKAYQSNATSRNEIAATINEIAAQFGHGRLDVVVANAETCTNRPNLRMNHDEVMTESKFSARFTVLTQQPKERDESRLVL